MKSRILLAAIAAAAVVAPLGVSAQTASVSFSIENNSSSTIDSIFYGRSVDSDWSDNILSEEIAPGETVEITVDDGLDDCEYDFHYTFADGSDYTETGVDMCELDGTTYEFTN